MKPGRGEAAVELDDFGFGADVRFDLVVAADRHDPAVGYGERFGHRVVGVDGRDGAAAQHEVGGGGGVSLGIAAGGEEESGAGEGREGWKAGSGVRRRHSAREASGRRLGVVGDSGFGESHGSCRPVGL